VPRLPLFGAVVAAVAVACGRPAGYPASVGPSHPLYGKPMPAIHHRTTLDGQPFDSAQLAGKPVLVKFFADYCQPCRETLPAAERIHEAHPEVVFLGIDEDESAETAQALAQRYGLTFPVVHDESNVLSGRFRVSALPTTFVADRSGVVRWVGADGQTEDDLKSAVETAARGP
jgi:cytochrome c biogenesis protein CcmG/thiol:disulfide interchange protein DsbE